MQNYQNEFTQEFENYEYNNEYMGEYNQEYGYSNEMQGEISSQEGTFSEATQMELASELLAVTNEAELDRFLGDLFKKAVGGVNKFMRSKTAKALGGILKKVAKVALPIAGRAGGAALAGLGVPPQIGMQVGGALGDAASGMFELELEGLSQEDREFEAAKAFVRFAGNAARQAASAPQHLPEGETARASITKSARKYAPGLLRRRSSSNSGRGFYILSERISRLEDAVKDLTEQLKLSGNTSSGGSSSSAPSNDNEYFEY